MTDFLKQPAIRITLVTAFLTAFLAFLKLGIGYAGKSNALVADGFHSIADVLIDVLVLFASHFGGKKADENHPYGHGRIETAATFGLAMLLIATAVGIIWDAGKSVWGQEIAVKPDRYVLWVAVAAIIINESLFRYTLIIAKRLKSSLLEANAWHSRSDAAVSIIVLLSIIAALWGFVRLDDIGAIIVGVIIAQMGAKLAFQSLSELVDTGVKEETLQQIRTVIKNVPGVHTLHHLRTRTIKSHIMLDVHILVAPKLSVSEGHFIGDNVIMALYEKIPDIQDIIVHVDPEDDEINHLSSSLPDRKTLEILLKDRFKNLPGAECIQHMQLHYLAGKISIDLFLANNAIDLAHKVNTLNQLNQQYKKAIDDLGYIQDIVLWLKSG